MSQDPTRSRRSYGTGSLVVRRDRNGRETWAGKWRKGDRQIMRRLGPKRVAGSREGLTRPQAQARLRELMTTVEPVAAVSDRLDVGEAGRRYVANMRDAGRKASSVKGVESTLRCWLVPYLGGRALDTITPDDVRDLMATMRRRTARSRWPSCGGGPGVRPRRSAFQ